MGSTVLWTYVNDCFYLQLASEHAALDVFFKADEHCVSVVLSGSTSAGEAGAREPGAQYETDEDVEGPGDAVWVQEAVLPQGSEPGAYWARHPGCWQGYASSVMPFPM